VGVSEDYRQGIEGRCKTLFEEKERHERITETFKTNHVQEREEGLKKERSVTEDIKAV
jgi:hypothetical protein